eukprot:s133_g1.t1
MPWAALGARPSSQTTSKQTISKYSDRSERRSTRTQKCWFPVRVCWDTDKLGLKFGPLEEQEGGLPVRTAPEPDDLTQEPD